MYDAQLIAPYNSGLKQYFKPFLTDRDSFTEMLNCYTTRGTVRKREGTSLIGRLPVWATGATLTDASPPVVAAAAHGLATGDMVWLENVVNSTITSIAPSASPTTITTAAPHGLGAGDIITIEGVTGTMDPYINDVVFTVLSVGSNTFTINADTNGLTYIAGGTVFLEPIDNHAFQITVINPNSFSLQYLGGSNPGGNVAAAGPATGIDVFLPVVGLRQRIIPTSVDQNLVGFNPKKAYLFVPGSPLGTFTDISFTPTGTPVSWTGTKDNFFWTSNYANSMWITNNVDHIRYWNGNALGICDFNPTLDGSGTTLDAALLVIPYKGRLVCLNTLESGNRFRQRATFSQVGTPYVLTAPGSPDNVNPAPFGAEANAWRNDIPGRGGRIDADTSEAIVSGEIINDVLIVAFEYSTWRLRYTGNEVIPFLWERIDTQFGSESTFGMIPMDDRAFYISRRGIVAGAMNGVQRIDLDIPDFVQSINTDTIGQGFTRIFAQREYDRRLDIWIYDSGSNNTPDQVLCYNYQDNTWAKFELPLCCLGRYKVSSNNTWATWVSRWEGDTATWADLEDEQVNEFIIVGGRTDSWVLRLFDPSVGTDPDVGSDAEDDDNNYNFTLTTKFFNPYFDKAHRCRLAFCDLYFTASPSQSLAITAITNANPAQVTTSVAHGLNTGSTVILSNISDMSVLNNVPFTIIVNGTNTFLLDNVNTTSIAPYTSLTGEVLIYGEITVQHFIDDDTNTPICQRRVNLGRNDATGKYVRVYLNAIARFHQITLTLSNGEAPFLTYPPSSTIDNQLLDVYKGITPFELQGMVLHTRREGRLKQ